MSKNEVFQSWLQERNIEDVEAFVPDMAGSARGKVVPADKFGASQMKMPEAIFSQTISGDYVADPENVEDRDMWLVPDSTTLRPVPWATDPAASVFLDCYHRDGSLVSKSPRAVLRSVLAKDEARGWMPVRRCSAKFWRGAACLARRSRRQKTDPRGGARAYRASPQQARPNCR